MSTEGPERKPCTSHDKLSDTKQLTLEASRILENCISQMEIVATLPRLLQLNSVSGVVDLELNRELHKHQELSDRLETLEGLRQESQGEQEYTFEEERAQLEQDIKDSVKNLLRLFRKNPDAISGLKAEQDVSAGQSEWILIQKLKMFYSIVMEKLEKSVDEELGQAPLRPVPSSPCRTQDKPAKGEETLTTDIKELEEKITQKYRLIHNLLSQLEEKNKEEEELTILMKKQSRSQVQTSKMNQLQQEVDQLQMKLNNLFTENRQAERAMQEKNEMLKMETEGLLQTFDANMTRLQANLELHQKDYERELDELKKLEEPYSILEVEFNQIQEKLRLEQEKRKEEMKELMLKTKAALYAQAWWRGYSTRKALKNKGKIKKAKKGKGKTTN